MFLQIDCDFFRSLIFKRNFCKQLVNLAAVFLRICGVTVHVFCAFYRTEGDVRVCLGNFLTHRAGNKWIFCAMEQEDRNPDVFGSLHRRDTAHIHACFSFDNQLDQREQKFWTQRTSLLKLKGHHTVPIGERTVSDAEQWFVFQRH